jgi:hypothetical protein
VDDERRYTRERSCRHGHCVALRAEAHGQLAFEDVEAIRVVTMDVQVCAVATRPETRPCRVQRLVVGEDLDAPFGRVADHLTLPWRDEDVLTHHEAA